VAGRVIVSDGIAAGLVSKSGQATEGEWRRDSGVGVNIVRTRGSRRERTYGCDTDGADDEGNHDGEQGSMNNSSCGHQRYEMDLVNGVNLEWLWTVRTEEGRRTGHLCESR
jgi:hypothetical protein